MQIMSDSKFQYRSNQNQFKKLRWKENIYLSVDLE